MQKKAGAFFNQIIAGERLLKYNLFKSKMYLPRGLVVRIRRSHRRGPGSIPGVGILFISFALSKV